MNTLTNLLKNKKTLLVAAGSVATLLLVFVLVSGGLGGGAFFGAAGEICDYNDIPQDTESTRWGMVVVENGMNVRASSNANSGLLGMIEKCTIFEVKGRTADTQWLAIQVQGTNQEGWVKNGEDFTGKWLYYRSDLSVIPVSDKTYTGIFIGSGNSALPDNYVSIWNNTISTGKLTGLPANQACTVTLEPAGSPGKAVVIWQGTTDGDGATSFQAAIPSSWSDGSAVKSGNLSIVVQAGGASKSWSLYYQK